MIQTPSPHILILKPCCLGDVLLATPLAAAIKAHWPDATIDWAVDRHSRAALARNPDIASLIDATGCMRGDFSIRSVIRLVRTLRRNGYDAAFVPDRSPITAIIPALAGIPVRVGLDRGGRGRWHTVRVPVPSDGHEVELYLELARAVGIPVPDHPRLVFIPSVADRARAGAEIDGVDLSPGDGLGPWVALHPGGGVNPGMTLLAKRWPADRFAAVADHFTAAHGMRIALLGGPGERDVADAVLAAMGPEARARTRDLAGRLSLGEVAAVVERCRLYVGNDTGVTHLAAAVGTPVVAIFGPTRPERYGPLPGAGVAVRPPDSDAAAVDRLSDASGSRVIESVTVDAVVAACEGVLGMWGCGMWERSSA